MNKLSLRYIFILCVYAYYYAPRPNKLGATNWTVWLATRYERRNVQT